MTSLEKNLWAWLYKGVRYTKGLHITRIENGADTGTPDVEGCYLGNQFWIELKVGELQKNGNVKLRYEPKQIPWLKKRWKCGGWAWTLIKVERERFLIKGSDLDNIQGGKPTLEELRECNMLPAKPRPLDVILVASGQPI